MKRYIIAFCILCLFAPGLWADTNFGSSSLQEETRQHFGASFAPFVVSGCLPVVPASSLTIAAFPCTAIVNDASVPPQQIPVVQSLVALTVPDSPTVWVAIVPTDIGAAPAGWTREASKRTHYAFQASATLPATQANVLIFARVTVAASVITGVTPFAYRSPVDAIRQIHDVTKWGATGDGTTDDNAALVNVFAATTIRTSGLFFPPGTYIHTSVLTPGSFTVISGYGATLKAQDALGFIVAGIDIVSINFVSIYGLTYDGNHPNRAAPLGHGILIDNADDIYLQDVQVRNSTLDGIQLAYTIVTDPTTRAQRVTFVNVMGDNSFRNGLAVVGVRDFLALNTTWTNSAGTSPEFGVDIEADNALTKPENVTFINVNTSDNAANGFGFGDNDHLNIRIIGLTTRDNGAFGYKGPGVDSTRVTLVGFDANGNTSGPFDTAQIPPLHHENVKYFGALDSGLSFTGTDPATWNVGAQYNNTTSAATRNIGVLFVTESNGTIFLGAAQNAGNTAGDFVIGQRNVGVHAETLRLTAAGALNWNSGTPITKHLSGEATNLVSLSIAANTCGLYGTITVLGANVTDTVYASPNGFSSADGIEDNNLSWGAVITTSDTVIIRACNPTGGAIDTADDQEWRVDVWAH